MQKTYTYQRKDGGTTDCYGKVEEGANFQITCRSELADGVWTDNESLETWPQVCKYLEATYNPHIEELAAV